MITASALSRLLNCPGSAVLPRAENASVWADRGNEAHAELAEGVGGAEHDYAHLIPPGSRSEVALGFDTATRVGRIIGDNLGRSYGEIGPYEIVGSADAIGIEGDAAIVVDFKTGFNDVEPAATNAQLAFYALAATRALSRSHPISRAIVRIIYTKQNRVDEAELDLFELSAFADRLAALHGRVATLTRAKQNGEPVETREGSWCRYCASKHVCPSKAGLLVQVAEKGLAVIGDSAITPERATAAYEQITKIEQLVKEARARLTTYVDEQGPIDLGNGRMFGRYFRPGNKKLDGNVAVQAIREVVGESAKEFEAIAIERSTSQVAIERAAKQLAPKRGAAKLKQAIIDRIDKLGGMKHAGETYPIGEFQAGRDEPAAKPEIDLAAVNKLLAGAG